VAVFFGANWAYQVARKPGEILAPISKSFANAPVATWRRYRTLFERHSTEVISPEFLAALAQIESSGNPIASTYWRWQWSWNPLEIYRPASTALGMFQMTDGTFAEAQRYCLRSGRVATAGAWHDTNSCWFNRFYTRLLPGHATELTAAYLHRSVTEILAGYRGPRPNTRQKERLAAVVHLCGKQRGAAFARNLFRTHPGERCAAHSVSGYISRLEFMKRRFARLRRSGSI
jgi:hypothetical protein